MVPGYNHNINYKGRVYHIQTEDSGINNPHIITHVFVGGNIVSSRKTSYADIVAVENVSEMIVELMQNQHKGMLKDLIRGCFDAELEARSVNAAALDGPAPLNVTAGQNRVSLMIPSAPDQPAASPPVAAAASSATKATPAPVDAPPPETIFSALPPPPPRSLNFSRDEPTTKVNIFGEVAAETSTAKVIEAATLEAAFESDNKEAVDSIFGEDLISEKSLDEVILSYLADDLQQD